MAEVQIYRRQNLRGETLKNEMNYMYDIELDKKHIRKNISLEGKERATSTVLLTNFRASL